MIWKQNSAKLEKTAKSKQELLPKAAEQPGLTDQRPSDVSCLNPVAILSARARFGAGSSLSLAAQGSNSLFCEIFSRIKTQTPGNASWKARLCGEEAGMWHKRRRK